MNKVHIYLSNLEYNYKFLRSFLKPNTALFAVVKAGGYGSEMIKIAKHLEVLGADYLAVAYAEEGKILREEGIETPILVFYPQVECLETILEAHLEPSLYSISLLSKFKKILEDKGEKYYPIHIKYNTGLNRVGFAPDEFDCVMKQLQGNIFELKSVYSHLAASEAAKETPLNIDQIKAFLALKKQHQDYSNTSPKFHLLNSSGIFNYPEHQFDAVRSGIALHGFANNYKWDKHLKPVAELISTISQIHVVKKGDYVGYNFGWKAPKESKIATLPIGHADGIGRHFGNQVGSVFLKGNHVPIVGNVCMDMLMIDVTGISCTEGDTVQFFGCNYSVAGLAEKGGTISYELLSSIGPRVERVIHS